MRINRIMAGMLVMGVIALGAAEGCNSGSSEKAAPSNRAAQSLYDKYGGLPTIQKIVDDAVAGVIADCVENPYFTNNVIDFDDVNTDGQGHGANGYDTVDRLKSCLDAQFTAAFGGPSTYTGTAAGSAPSRSTSGLTYTCQDMSTAHAGLGIPPSVFDQFISDVGSVLAQDGINNADATTVAAALIGYKSDIVAPADQEIYFDYQPGQPSSPAGVACTIAGPGESPMPMPSSMPSPIPTPAPSMTQ